MGHFGFKGGIPEDGLRDFEAVEIKRAWLSSAADLSAVVEGKVEIYEWLDETGLLVDSMTVAPGEAEAKVGEHCRALMAKDGNETVYLDGVLSVEAAAYRLSHGQYRDEPERQIPTDVVAGIDADPRTLGELLLEGGFDPGQPA